MSSVMAIVECPSRSCTTVGCSPCWNNNVACECRKSWNRIRGKPFDRASSLTPFASNSARQRQRGGAQADARKHQVGGCRRQSGIHPDVSIEVADVDAVHAKAVPRQLKIPYPLTNEP